MSLELCPISLKTANAFVQQYHRHHKPVVTHKFSIGVWDGESLVGVAICGRPVNLTLDDGWTLEVSRVCTNGTYNACSILYAACWRAAKAMGYHKIITYTLETEPGTSLRASGWTCEGEAGNAYGWPNRKQKAKTWVTAPEHTRNKVRWSMSDGKEHPSKPDFCFGPAGSLEKPEDAAQLNLFLDGD